MIRTENDFWNLIDETRQEVGSYEIDELLTERLSDMELDDACYFYYHLQNALRKLCKSEIVALYVILTRGNGGSDDSFEYFRCWLVAQGKDVYEKSLNDPNSLSEYLIENDFVNGDDNNFDYEMLLSVADDALYNINDDVDFLDLFYDEFLVNNKLTFDESNSDFEYDGDEILKYINEYQNLCKIFNYKTSI